MMEASAAKGAEDVAKTLAAEMARLSAGGAVRAPERASEERYNRRWAKTAQEIGLKRLRKDKRVSLVSFVSWRENVERWARLAGGDIKQLSPEEVADAAVHFLDDDLLVALKAND